MKKISIAIPTYNSSLYLQKCLKGFRSLQPIGEIVIADDGSTDEELYKINEIVEIENTISEVPITLFKNTNNKGAFKNKYEVIEKCNFEIVYQIDSDNIPGNNIFNVINKIVNNFNSKYIYYPSRLYQFRKFHRVSLLNRNKQVRFTSRSIELGIEEVQKSIINNTNLFEDKHIGWVLNCGNFIVNRKNYLTNMKEGLLTDDLLSSDAVAISYYWLKNGGKIFLDEDHYHFHRKRWDSVSFTEGKNSKISAELFFNKIIDL